MIAIMFIIGLLINFGKTLKCYDSQTPQPDRISECGANELCYSEYYSLHASKHLFNRLGGGPTNVPLVHFYDRFCVHEQHCKHRGLNPDSNCLDVHALDLVVRKTFYGKLRKERLDPRRLALSRFCCCGKTNLCNDLSAKTIAKIYNISTDETVRNRGRKAPTTINGNSRVNILGIINLSFLFSTLHIIIYLLR